MSDVEDPGVVLEKTLERIKGYEPSFAKDVEENILLKELYNSCEVLKRYADEYNKGAKAVSSSPLLEELEGRVKIAEGKTSELLSLNETLELEVGGITNDIFLLKAKDEVLKEDIEKISKVDEEIRTDVETKQSDLEKNIDALKAEDVSIVTKMTDGKKHIDGEIDKIDGKLEEIDLDGIEEELTELEKEDVVIQQMVDTNHTENSIAINKLKEEVDELELDSIRNDISALKEVDIEIEGEINTLKNETEETVTELENEDSRIRGEIKNIDGTLDGIKENLVESSEAPEAGKAPVGLEGGFIHEDWIDI